eukprot:188289-Rhodomonas_salina.1
MKIVAAPAPPPSAVQFGTAHTGPAPSTWCVVYRSKPVNTGPCPAHADMVCSFSRSAAPMMRRTDQAQQQQRGSRTASQWRSREERS